MQADKQQVFQYSLGDLRMSETHQDSLHRQETTDFFHGLSL